MSIPRWRGRLVILPLGLLLSLPSAASAIPAFARKYSASCNLCHAPAPRLNAFGEQFAANGFEFVPGEAPGDTMDTGDDLLRLLRRIDLAMRLDAYASLSRPLGRERAGVDLQTPYNMKVLSGGVIAPRISYYVYFFLTERGEVTGLEDAYIQFTDVAGRGMSVIAGQFQVSDPLFKRELRLPYEDYHAYRVRVGAARADLTYDRGLMISAAPWAGGDVVLMVVNGQGLRAAGADRLYDRDHLPNLALRYSQEVGAAVRLGAFGYWGLEGAEGRRDRIVMWGPDATIAGPAGAELNLQYVRREDSNPLLQEAASSTHVDAGFAELIMGPAGRGSRAYATLLYNVVRASAPLISLRVGEQELGTGYLQRYETIAGGAHYLLHRNVRIMAEAGWDLELDRPRFTTGLTLAW
jgi:hypothetical protein